MNRIKVLIYILISAFCGALPAGIAALSGAQGWFVLTMFLMWSTVAFLCIALITEGARLK